MSRSLRATIGATLCGAMLGGGAWLGQSRPADAVALEPASVLHQLQRESAELYAKVRESVIVVELTRGVTAPPVAGGPNPASPTDPTLPNARSGVTAVIGGPDAAPLIDPPVRWRDDLPQALAIQIDADGYALVPLVPETALPRDARLSVWTLAGRRSTATYLGSDRQTGVSVLKLNEPIATPARAGEASRPDDGRLMMVWSAPEQVPTLAIWSNLTRQRGVVIDLDGAIRGFADAGQFVPVALLDGVKRQLAERGEVRRPRLGVWLAELALTAPERTEDAPSGRVALRVEMVVSGSIAERAGIRSGDYLLQVDDIAVGDLASFAASLAFEKPSIKLTVQRDGASRDIDVRLDRQ